MNSFFLCHNPLGGMPEGRVGYIYNYDQPRFFASIIEIDYNKRLPDLNLKGQNIMFSYLRGDGRERIFIIMVMQSGGERSFHKIKAALKYAAHWYVNCLNKDDMKTFDKVSTWSPMRDYSSAVPGIQALHVKTVDQYLMSYPMGLSVFDKLEDLQSIIKILAEEGTEVGPGSLNFV